MKAIFSRVRHPSHPGRGHGSLTCYMTQFERSDWLRSENFTNIMIEYWTDNNTSLGHLESKASNQLKFDIILVRTDIIAVLI